ncbi:MAG: hypothetical protein Q8909_13260 [Bacteroidota bacterium]|nr:hypothetical protein [Bacteroidota bacterium]
MEIVETSANGNVYAGTFGGLLLTVFSNLFVEDMMRTIILAVIGAVVSFVVSLTLKELIRWFKR